MNAEAATKPRPAHERILDRYSKPVVVTPEESDRSAEILPSVIDAEATAEAGCFGYLRGTRDMAVMLELRKKDGSVMALSYSYIEHIDYDPETGIAIHALGRTIRIQGTNLNTPIHAGSNMRLFQGLTRHRIVWISEERELVSSSGGPGVQSVQW